MSCNTALSAITHDCVANVGGIKELLLANFSDVTSVTLDATSAKVSAITMASTLKFIKYYIRPESASFTSTPQYNDAGDYAGEEGILTLTFNRRDTAKRTQIALLSLNDLRVIFRDNNGMYWLMGFDNPVRRNGGDEVTGTAYGDTNAYGIQLRMRDLQPVYEVPDSVVASII